MPLLRRSGRDAASSGGDRRNLNAGDPAALPPPAAPAEGGASSEDKAKSAFTYMSDAELRERHLRANFSSIPEVHRFHNHLVSGDASRFYLDYFRAKYFGDGRPVDALSLGSGNGHLERTLLGSGWRFASLVGLELNPTLAEFAQAEVAALPGASAVRYRTADLNRLSLEPSTADLAIFFHSLHHVEALQSCLLEVTKALRPGGILLVVDYFGPNRIQRSDELLALCDLFLRRMPETYRIDVAHSTSKNIVIKERCEKPSADEVARNDPSEAVHSEEIEATLRANASLELLEEKPLGGTFLEPLFENIAGNFKADDETAMAYVHMAIAAEEALLRSRAVRSYFRFMVLRKKK